MSEEVTKPVILDETGRRMAAALEDLALSGGGTNIILMLDGTPKTYKKIMRQWFLSRDAVSATAAELTALCDEWYSITRMGWNGAVRFYQPSTSPVSDGIKLGNNEGLICIPSTDTVAGRDDYAGLPLFACVDCNWIMNGTEPQITAIEGISPGFKRYDPNVFVGVLQMAGYTYNIEEETTYTIGYTDGVGVDRACDPVPESVRVDGTIRPWVVHAKYMSGWVNDKMTCCAGAKTRARDISHNTLHTKASAIGIGYSGGTMADWAWLILMGYIKYGALDSDRFIAGCNSFNFSDWVQASETDVNRVLIPAASASRYDVGCTILIGTSSDGTINDRNVANAYALSGADGRLVTDIRTVTIDDTELCAVYFDGDPITTTKDPSAIGGTFIQSYHWPTGTTDVVLGNDGSIKSCTSGKYPAKLQGIEYAVGAYEVIADAILNWIIEDEHNACEVNVCKLSSKYATSVTEDYEKVCTFVNPYQDANAWRYIRKMFHKNGLFFPDDVNGGSSSTGTRDAFWCYGDTTTTGLREVIVFANLTYGLGPAGRSIVPGSTALSLANWHLAGRLSPNGNRG